MLLSVTCAWTRKSQGKLANFVEHRTAQLVFSKIDHSHRTIQERRGQAVFALLVIKSSYLETL